MGHVHLRCESDCSVCVTMRKTFSPSHGNNGLAYRQQSVSESRNRINASVIVSVSVPVPDGVRVCLAPS